MTNLHTDNTKAEIRETIQNYVHGYLEAEGATLALAFHPETRLHSASEEGRLERTEMQEWQSGLRARKERGDIRKGEFEIEFIDVAGDSAVAKVILKLPNLMFTDYLSLLRLRSSDPIAPESGIERKWVITGKIYTVS